MMPFELTGDGRDASVLDPLAEDDRDRILDDALFCDFCERIYPAAYSIGASGSNVMCPHCHFAQWFGAVTGYIVTPADHAEDDDDDDPTEGERIARAGLLAYVTQFLPFHDPAGCWQAGRCFLCDARARAVDLDDPGAIGAWLAHHGFDPRAEAEARIAAAADAAAKAPMALEVFHGVSTLRHRPSGLVLAVVRPADAPAFAITPGPLTIGQAANLLGHDAIESTTGSDAPWTGFDLNQLGQLYRDELRLPTATEREVARRVGATLVLDGVDELVGVDVYAQEIEVMTSSGQLAREPLPDLGKLDAIGQRIPNRVPPSVGIRLACSLG